MARILVLATGVSRDDLAAELFVRTSVTSVSETIGRLSAIEFEVRNNPDSGDIGGPGASWLYFPVVVECYSDLHSLEGENCKPKVCEAIDLVLGALNDIGAHFVTASSLEQHLVGNGRNRSLDD